ncbi:hypothetical protein [Paenibacillus sp. FJAT-26967]|uniref:hypothetical protein n=1 Tax=Paenibacillus sp. FJAT-26967 TaxID=1729690 RepID=UPI000837BBD8|nr:hypothetical protein [Paenibacillus sp. FJAT-26967]
MTVISENAFFILILLLVFRVIRQEIRFWIRYIAHLLLHLSPLLNLMGTCLMELIEFGDDSGKKTFDDKRKKAKKK